MEENRSTFRLSGREKAGLIWHYLRPCWGHFAAALLCACLSMALNALTPQIIRLTVDSVRLYDCFGLIGVKAKTDAHTASVVQPDTFPQNLLLSP